MINEKRTIKCSICGKPRIILDSYLATIIENNYLRMCNYCERKAVKHDLPYPYIKDDSNKHLTYINIIRSIDEI